MMISTVACGPRYVFRYCSPTRRSFLSGRFPTLISTVQPDSKNMCSNFLPLVFTTLPEKLATAGYVSHHVGKGGCALRAQQYNAHCMLTEVD